MKKILLLLLVLTASTGAWAQGDELDSSKLDSLIRELEVTNLWGRNTPLSKIVDEMKAVAAPNPRPDYSPDPSIAAKEEECQRLENAIDNIKGLIEIEEKAQAGFEAQRDSVYHVLLLHEQLILSLVNDKFNLQYDPRQMEDARRLLKMVEYHNLKPNLVVLVENYGDWIANIDDILEQAKTDFAANPRRWDAFGGSSQADVFIAKLDACEYMKRKDKNWKIAYLDEFIKLAKSQISLYKNKNKRGRELDFTEIPVQAAAAVRGAAKK